MPSTPLILKFECEKLCSSPGFTTDDNLLFKLGHFESKRSLLILFARRKGINQDCPWKTGIHGHSTTYFVFGQTNPSP